MQAEEVDDRSGLRDIGAHQLLYGHRMDGFQLCRELKKDDRNRRHEPDCAIYAVAPHDVARGHRREAAGSP